MIALALVLTLAPGAQGEVRAVSRENPSGERPAAEAAAPGQPELQAQSWALTDAKTGLYLAGKNPNKRLPIASTTNIMTALVVLEEGVDLDEKVVVSEQAERYVGFTYSNVGLIAGERLTVRDLLVAALVPSGTDAVYALAEHVGDGRVDRFVEKMNQETDTMGLKNTHFENPAGLDSPGNYSSARDLATLARAAMEHPTFADMVGKREAKIRTQYREIEVFNTNYLLYSYPEATGIKTGTSPKAGPCLVTSATSGDESYVAVVLGARDDQYRFEAAQVALGYGFDGYEQRPLVQRGKVYGESPLPYRRGESVALAAAEELAGPTGPGLEVERRITEGEPPLAARGGQELGTIEVLVDGQSVGSRPLVAEKGYEEASLWDKARYAVIWPAEKVWGWLSPRVAAP
ncbi:MAG: D-alanyl-D-alanine carboxypeptidase [Actinomycetota bacterium]|nr:D-alanyl-D-alanine carboxypeptidase [Actinomycetota bacterium]